MFGRDEESAQARVGAKRLAADFSRLGQTVDQIHHMGDGVLDRCSQAFAVTGQGTQPRVGTIVLFPSYMWHGTIPFGGEHQRMTCALDIIPK